VPVKAVAFDGKEQIFGRHQPRIDAEVIHREPGLAAQNGRAAGFRHKF